MPPKSVVPVSSKRSEVPMGRPAWPASSWSSDCVPVDVVMRPSWGEGRVPCGREFSAFCTAGALGFPKTTPLFRKDILNMCSISSSVSDDSAKLDLGQPERRTTDLTNPQKISKVLQNVFDLYNSWKENINKFFPGNWCHRDCGYKHQTSHRSSKVKDPQ